MAVINPTGVVGKIIRVFPTTSQVLEINDQTSGIGATLETSRIQGILKGAPAGDAQLNYIMSYEAVKPGERVVTSGNDHIFPRGVPVGTVTSASAGDGNFLNIRVRPAANLNRLEEVLVITKISDRDVEAPADSGKRAADILADRLPSIPVKPPDQPGAAGATGTAAQPGAAAAGTGKPGASAKTGAAKPGAAGTTSPATKPTATGAAAAKPSTSKPTTGAAKPKTITDLPPTSGSAKPASGAASTAASGTSAKPKSPATSTTPGASTAPKKSATPASPKTPDNQPSADNKPHTETTPQ
jgi:rod shape-determining protein MreC